MNTILTIDDNADTRELHEILLGFEGYHVITASSSDDALEIISSNATIDLILCDIQMPSCDGYEFVKAFRKEHPDRAAEIPVVFSSAEIVDLPEGVIDQIPKMTDVASFVSKIKSLSKINSRFSSESNQ